MIMYNTRHSYYVLQNVAGRGGRAAGLQEGTHLERELHIYLSIDVCNVHICS